VSALRAEEESLDKISRKLDNPLTSHWSLTLEDKFRAEVHYAVIRPETFGNEWTFMFRIAPIISNPFK
jgi:hypothetical protein